MILTNKLKVSLDYDAISSDFDLYIVTKDSAKLERTNVLDIPVNKFKALSVQYSFGKQAFVLFKKNSVDEFAFRDCLNSEFEDKDVKVYHITPNDLNDEEFREKNFFLHDRLLVQLLLNSLMNVKTDSLTYNNLTGKLFYSNGDMVLRDKETKEINFMSFLEIRLDPGMCLNLSVKTFKREDLENVYAQKDSKSKRIYVLDDKTGKLRKKLKTDDQQTVFIEGSLQKKHMSVDFLNIESYKKFQKSKLGVMGRFIKDVKETLGRYLTIEFSVVEESTPYEISKKEKKDITDKDIGAFLEERGVNIVDENHSEKSHIITEKLKEELSRFYGITPSEGSLSRDKYNIRIIHEQEYYEKNKLHDLHQDILSGYLVQHMTEEGEFFEKEKSDKKKSHEEDSGENSDEKITEGKDSPKRNAPTPAVHKVVQELIIKEDVANEQISIYDWSGLDSDKEWTFITRIKIKNVNGDLHVNAANQNTYDFYSYQVLRIDMDGKLIFSAFDDKSSTKTELQNKICFAFDDFSHRYHSWGTVEALVFSDENNIHAIIATNERTLPSIDMIAKGLKETDGKRRVPCEDITDGINTFVELNKLSEDEASIFKELRTKLEESPTGEITMSEIRKALGMGKRMSKTFNRFMHENYNIWISAEMKDQEFNDDFMLDNLLNIKYYYQVDPDGTPSFYYYVGTKRGSLQRSVHNACVIRKVVSQTGELEFTELLPLMVVEFVRDKQYTVLPFPFKYLREWTNR